MKLPEFKYRSRILAAMLFSCCLLSSVVSAQETVAEDIKSSDVGWQPPNLAELPVDWWARLDADSPDTAKVRIERFLELVNERISGLDPDNMLVGQSSTENLGSLVELLIVAKQSQGEPEFEPIPTQDRYFLTDMLILQDQARRLETDRLQTTLEIEQTERKVQLLQERRDSLLRRYESSTKEAPERILTGLAGVVREINTRAAVVNTTDGIDVVVPNSELVTTKLTNWTLRESIARVRIGFGVAYGSDKERVREVALQAAEEMEFIILNMPGREPQVRLVNFGDSLLDFELLAWVSRQGVRRPHRVRASFLWALETRLGEAGIEIPFPQRDLHIKSDSSGAR